MKKNIKRTLSFLARRNLEKKISQNGETEDQNKDVETESSMDERGTSETEASWSDDGSSQPAQAVLTDFDESELSEDDRRARRHWTSSMRRSLDKIRKSLRKKSPSTSANDGAAVISFDDRVEDWTWPCVDASDGRVLLNYEIPMDLAVGDIPADLVVGEDVSLLDALDALLNDDQIRAEPTGVFIRDLDFKCFAWNNRCLYNNDQVLAANGYALPLGMTKEDVRAFMTSMLGISRKTNVLKISLARKDWLKGNAALDTEDVVDHVVVETVASFVEDDANVVRHQGGSGTLQRFLRKQIEVITVEFQLGDADRLGLYVLAHDDKGPFVDGFDRRGVALQDGRLINGDLLTAINGRPLTDLSPASVRRVVREVVATKTTHFSFVVARKVAARTPLYT